MAVEDVSVIFYLMALAIAVTILHTFLKQAGRDEYAYLALVAGLALALVRVLPVLRELFAGVQAVFSLYD
ncbi:MAG: stage III sporulation protein AC [Firmicutes bacterium]|nr:stage III sporulation protein AC [Bacillota bacterium]